MRGSTFLLVPSSSDRRNAGKISFLFFSLRLLLLCPIFFPLLFFHGFPHFSFLFLFSFGLILSHQISYFVCYSPSHFLLIFPFSLFSFSLFFHFLLSFPSFSLFYLFFLLSSIGLSKSGGNFPHLPPLPLVNTMFFFLIFFIFLSCFILHITLCSI